MEDQMVSIDRLKLRAAIREKFGTQAEFYVYLETHADELGKGFSGRNVEAILKQGSIRESMLNAFAELLDRSFDYFLPLSKVPWTIPTQEWAAWRPPCSLLRAEFEIVPFQREFREREIDELKKWCRNKETHGIALRLITGQGGMGKTRLAIELCRQMQKEGWRAGFLDYSAFRRDEQRWEELLAEHAHLLLVLDYAEHRLEELAWLLPVVSARTPGAISVRLLVLARDAGDWWSSLQSKKEAGDLLADRTSYMHPLKPLTIKREDRAISWHAAAARFAKCLGKTITSGPDSDLSETYFERVLMLHMSALLAVEGESASGREGILDYILHREQRFWAEHLKARGLPLTLLDGVKLFMALVTCKRGVASCDSGMNLLGDFKFFEGQSNDVLNAINQMLHECYPERQSGDQEDDERGSRGLEESLSGWIEPLQPDLLGDHLMNVSFSNIAFGKEVHKLIAASNQKVRRDRR
jgi:hypothetical protein